MAFQFDKLTVKAQNAVQRAQKFAEDRGHQQILPLHLLKALTEEEQGIVRPVLQKIGANLSQLESMIDGELKRLPKVTGAGVQVSVSPSSLQMLDKSLQLAD